MRRIELVAVCCFMVAGCGESSPGASAPDTGVDSQSAAGALANAERWISTEFQPSTLSEEAQLAEMQWFIQAALPLRGMRINVVSETLITHEYESEVLARAFAEITGIQVTHDLIQEGDVIEKLQTQMQSGQNVYDAYVNDSDLIGTHARYGYVVPLSDFMTGDGADVTSPTLDLADFIGSSFTTGPDGKLYQLPDQQFANLYWFRYDWFQRPELREQFREHYGYELGVPVNWSAYEDIAEFFSTIVQTIDGERFTATWITARKTHRSAGALPMPGCPWPAQAIRASPMATRSTSGVSGLRAAVPWAPPSPAAGRPMAPLRSMRSRSTWSGCRNTRHLQRPE